MDPNFTKHHLLEFINPDFETEDTVNPHRYSVLKNGTENKYDKKVIYLMNRNFRVEDNFAINLAIQKTKEEGLELEILIFLEKLPEIVNKKKEFLDKNLDILKNNLTKNNFRFKYLNDSKENLKKLLKKENPMLLIYDFNPIQDFQLEDLDLKIIEVDSYNIIPARYNDDSQAYNAASLRRKTYKKIFEFLTYFPDVFKGKIEKNEGYAKLEDFLETKLSEYSKYKNNPVLNVTSQLSPYLNWGFISAQRVALEIIKSENTYENKESYLEELVIRKELSDNFCLYAKDYKSFDSLPDWAKLTINQHKYDIRPHIFSLKELENAKTSDPFWNASQNQLLKEGKIHGYMRMYWAKTIALWSNSAQEAIDKAIYLNDKYAFDAPSANGYVGILWSIGGLHDRPFQDFPVTGKIRRMTYNGAKSKFDTEKYIQKYSTKES